MLETGSPETTTARDRPLRKTTGSNAPAPVPEKERTGHHVTARLRQNPLLAGQILGASLVVNLLGLASTVFVIQVFNRYVGHGIDGTLYTLSAGMVLALLMEFGFRQIRQRLAIAIAIKPDRALNDRTFATLTQARVTALDALPPGLRQEVLQGLNAIQSAYAPANLLVMVDIPFALIYVVAIFLLHPLLGWAATAVLVTAAILSGIGSTVLQRLSKSLIQAQSQHGTVAEAANHGDMVRAFNVSGLLIRRWRERTAATRVLRNALAHRQAAIQSFMQTCNGIMTLLIIGLGARLAVTGALDVGMLIGANILGARALSMLTRFGQLRSNLSQAKQSAVLLQKFFKLPMEPDRGTVPPQFAGQIEFRDFGYQYPEAPSPLMESLTLTLEPGGRLAVVGDNGAGKTTLARLLMGLIEPGRGAVLIDGVDLRQLHPAWWRQQVVYLPQEPTFFDGSLRDNLSVLNPEVSDEALKAVLKTVGLASFLDENKLGLDLPMTNGGRRLSFGVRRRLSLARGLVSNGGLILLDEPMEALDEAGKTMMSGLIDHLNRQGRTVVALAHDADRILPGATVLDLNVKPVPAVRATNERAVVEAVWNKSETHLPAPAPATADEQWESVGMALNGFGALLLSMFLGLFVWSFFGQLDVFSLAQGEVVPASRVRQVQHLEGGIVQEILVREGEQVEKDQPLVILDATASGVNLGAVRQKIRTLRVDLIRLNAEAADQDSLSFDTLPPADDDARSGVVPGGNGDGQLLQQATRLFEARRHSYHSTMDRQRDEIPQRQQDIIEIEARQRNQTHRLQLLEEQIAISKTMLKSSVTSRYEHINLLKEKSSLESRVQEDNAGLQRARSALKQAEGSLTSIQDQYREEVRTAQEETQRSLNELTMQLAKYEDNMQRTVLRAPVKGTVKTLGVASRGSVVAPGATVLELVPGEDQLIVEAKLASQDVGHVAVGQSVVIRLASADANRFGKLDGVVEHISPDTLVTQDGVPYYLVRISMVEKVFFNGPTRYELVPGVVVSAGILTGRRSVFEYLMGPFTQGIHFALSER